MLLIRVLAVLVCFQIQSLMLDVRGSRFESRTFMYLMEEKNMELSFKGNPIIEHQTSNIVLNKNLHDFHTSLTELQYNPKEKSFEVSIRLFTDDLENTLTKFNGGKKVFIGGKNDNADEVIKRYIPQHFAVYTAQKQKKAMNVLGKEIEGDATWVYVEIPDSQGVIGGILQNDLLQEMFDDQSNLVNFFYQNQKKTFLFTSKVKAVEIKL